MGKKQRLKLERAKQATEAKKNDVPAPLWAQTGVTVFGALLIVSSIFHIGKLIGEGSLYVRIYSYLPPEWIVARYSFSWLQRLVGILAGLGIIVRKELARKLGIAVGLFTVLTVYWKHPYPAVFLHNQNLDEKIGQWLAWTGTGVTFTSVTPFSVAGLIIADIIFWAIFFYFFTRPEVKSQFKLNL